MVVHKLAEMNTGPYVHTWHNYTLKRVYAVGRYGRTGTHTHLVETEIVIAESGEHKPGTFVVGNVARSAPMCNSQRGQHGAQPVFDPRWDLVNITCKKCQKWLWGDGPRPIGVA